MKRSLSYSITFRFLPILLFVLCTVLSLSITARAAGFSCYVTDANGYQIDSYYAAEEDRYYLFLTPAISIPDITVHLNANITAASGGVLSADHSTLTGAFSANGDSVLLTDAGGAQITLSVLQTDLPSLCIGLDGVSLEQVHLDKSVKYDHTSVILSDPSGIHGTVSVDDASFKGRGNSSWLLYEKKGYQIKFTKKESVLGMPAAKKWILLPNACDDSLMRNYLAFCLAKESGQISSPDAAFVDLWINGDYRGTYLIAEKNEIGSGRVDLKDDLGGLFERDDIFFADEDHWFQDAITQDYYVLKESVNEDPETAANTMQLFRDRLDDLECFLCSDAAGPDNITVSDLETLIDVRSFAGFYLINEFMLNRESISSSFYWYLDGENDVLHMGPLWDFDTCAGIEFTEDSTSMYYIRTDMLFSELLRCKAFKNYVNEMYESNKAFYLSLPQLCEETGAYLERAASMNYVRWNTLGNAHAKGVFHDSYADAVHSLSGWLENRGKVFAVPSPYLYTEVSAANNSLKITLNADDHYSKVRFPIWSTENGQNDLVWYDAKRQSRDVWSCTINTADRPAAGTYMIHAYGIKGGSESMIGKLTTYVESKDRFPDNSNE